jgi:hypothetical protein
MLCHFAPFFAALATLSAATAALPSPSPSSQAQRFDFRGDIPAFLRSLPDSLGKQSKLVSILMALATGYPKEF